MGNPHFKLVSVGIGGEQHQGALAPGRTLSALPVSYCCAFNSLLSVNVEGVIAKWLAWRDMTNTDSFP